VTGESPAHQFASLTGAHQYLRLYDLVRRHVPRGGAVLDWGTGNGHFSYFLVRAGYDATGFSLLPPDFLSWVDGDRYRFVQGREEEPVTLPWEPGTFDAVASVGVLEHVRETGGTEAASLAEIGRILRPGGVFIAFHFPNQTSWIDSLASRVPGKHHHVYRYRRGDIEELVERAGLELLETRRYALLPRNTVHRWDATDGALGALFGALCQNHYFVARKPATSR
jgi:SAM-dependent methyltransferase